jgi:predicted dehydrogenase
MDTVRIGVVGVGHLGRFHAQNYGRIPEARLIGVTDTDAARRQTVAQEFSCEAFADPSGLFDQVDAVSIAVPTDRHFEIARAALEAGKHVLIEKPITQTVEEADRLIDLAESKNLIIHVGHVERFNPAMTVLSGTKLDPQFMESHRLAPFNPRGTEVAVVLDLMIHDIDIALALARSPVASVDASGVAVVSDTIDIANARIRFENDCVANLTASRISQKKMRKLRLFQRDAYISIDFLAKKTHIYELATASTGGIPLGEIGAGEHKRMVFMSQPDIPEQNALETELAVFIRSIRGESAPAVTGRAGRDALEVAIRILNQMEK